MADRASKTRTAVYSCSCVDLFPVVGHRHWLQNSLSLTSQTRYVRPSTPTPCSTNVAATLLAPSLTRINVLSLGHRSLTSISHIDLSHQHDCHTSRPVPVQSRRRRRGCSRCQHPAPPRTSMLIRTGLRPHDGAQGPVRPSGLGVALHPVRDGRQGQLY